MNNYTYCVLFEGTRILIGGGIVRGTYEVTFDTTIRPEAIEQSAHLPALCEYEIAKKQFTVKHTKTVRVFHIAGFDIEKEEDPF